MSKNSDHEAFNAFNYWFERWSEVDCPQVDNDDFAGSWEELKDHEKPKNYLHMVILGCKYEWIEVYRNGANSDNQLDWNEITDEHINPDDDIEIIFDGENIHDDIKNYLIGDDMKIAYQQCENAGWGHVPDYSVDYLSEEEKKHLERHEEEEIKKIPMNKV